MSNTVSFPLLKGLAYFAMLLVQGCNCISYSSATLQVQETLALDLSWMQGLFLFWGRWQRFKFLFQLVRFLKTILKLRMLLLIENERRELYTNGQSKCALGNRSCSTEYFKLQFWLFCGDYWCNFNSCKGTWLNTSYWFEQSPVCLQLWFQIFLLWKTLRGWSWTLYLLTMTMFPRMSIVTPLQEPACLRLRPPPWIWICSLKSGILNKYCWCLPLAWTPAVECAGVPQSAFVSLVPVGWVVRQKMEVFEILCVSAGYEARWGKANDMLCKYWPWGWANLVGSKGKGDGFSSWGFVVLSGMLGVLKVFVWCNLSFL